MKAVQMLESQAAMRQLITGSSHAPKCYGAAKNFFTGALKQNPGLSLPTYPWIFSKPFSSLLPRGKPFQIPYHAEEGAIVHEVELGVIFNDVSAEQASHWQDRVGAYVLLLDMGDMSLMKKAMTSGSSWFTAKAQDGFLVLSDLIPKEAIEDPHNCELELKINGETRQKDNTGNMLFKINEQVDYIEKQTKMRLTEGDLLMSGTPEGIAPVAEGDLLEATIHYQGKLVQSITQTIKREHSPC